MSFTDFSSLRRSVRSLLVPPVESDGYPACAAPLWRRWFAALVMLAVAAESHAADRFWNTFFGGTFSDAGNWQGNLAPERATSRTLESRTLI